MTGSRRIVLFGAGEAGRRALLRLKPGDRVVAVADNDRNKAGSHLCGHPIVSPEQLATIGYDRVVIASMYWREIKTQLVELGCAEQSIEVHDVSRPTAPTVAAPGSDRERRHAWAEVGVVVPAADFAPLVSVVMPNYNRAALLPRAVRSVFAQTYPYFELIVIDDGSEDDSMTVLQQLQQSDARVRIVQRSHAGVSAARNAGLAAARGDLIAYLDSDNRWHPDFLRLMTEHFADPAWSTGYAGMNVIDERTGRVHTRLAAFDFDRIVASNPIDLNVFIHRRALVEEAGGFDESLTRLVDWDLVARYTRRYPPFFLPGVLADYFIDAGAERVTDTEPFLDNRERMRARNAGPIPKHVRAPGPLRIAFVQHEFPALSQTFVQNEIRFLIAIGVQVSVFYVRESNVTGPVPDGLDSVRIASRDHLVHLLVARDVDLVHTHFAMPHLADLIVPVCERLGLPFTQKPHAFDIFRRDHDPRHHIGLSGSHELCRLVYCEGEYHRRFLAEEGVPVAKLKVVRNIFDLAEFRVRESTVAPRVRRIVSVSRFVEKKGYHLLIEAFRAIDDPGLSLALYGYGEESERLLALADGDQRIAVLDGPRSVAQAAPLFRNADLFALPCIADRHGDTDGLPTVLMEAMAAGVPVLTTPLASIPDLVEHRRTGYLVQTGSVDALIDGLQRAIAAPAEERERIVRAAWRHLDDEFDPLVNVRSILADWRAILDFAPE
ncbi:MAG: glycosyltransferase [Gammaproteobacteria bacterium]|nr:glycosyltransferase [Gammaproteobacteria bacterium]